MGTTLRMKYLIVYVLLACSMMLVINHYGQAILLDSLITDQKNTLYKEANVIAHNYILDIDSLSSQDQSYSALRTHFESLQTISDTRLWVTDMEGVIVMDSSNSSNQEGIQIPQYDKTFLNNQTFTGNLPAELIPDKILAIIYPLTSNQNTTGYLILLSSLDKLQQTTQGYFQKIRICFILFLVLLFLGLLYLSYQTMRPMKIMTKTIKEYTNGHFDYEMEKVTSGYEYKEFAAAVQYLASKMKDMIDYQKKFIANVSHDFRSPLTSIKGYVEAILDGTIPHDSQEKYLRIILFETERLSKLTQNILELNQIENNGFILEISTFDINQIVKTITASFEQQCTTKRISIQLIFSQKELLVDADINKIQQVIHNLIDNAIKFSHSDSSIEIHTIEHSGKAFVSVKDHGIGIPKEGLPRIWERFYKSDLSRGKDKTGTGLGLSITREILEAHNEHINVTSTEGTGTEFTFSLSIHASNKQPYGHKNTTD